MTQEHPITPPPELVQKWCHEDGDEIKTSPRWFRTVCTKAARWGADQELEACCEWLHWQNLATHQDLIPSLRDARRPKPPSLKAQALAAHGAEPLQEIGPTGDTILNAGAIERHRLIRRALEQLDD